MGAKRAQCDSSIENSQSHQLPKVTFAAVWLQKINDDNNESSGNNNRLLYEGSLKLCSLLCKWEPEHALVDREKDAKTTHSTMS